MYSDMAEKTTDRQAVTAGLIFSIVCGWVGIIIAGG